MSLKIMLSVDIEGISGVATTEFSSSKGSCYDKAKKLMMQNTNAVIEGILKKKPNATIIVRDAHSKAINLHFEDLHEKAHLIQGWGNGINMVEGIDESFDGVFLVGYHAGAQNRKAVLSHTLTSFFKSIKVNNKSLNEAGWAGLFAGHFDVPVVFLSGDDLAAMEAKKQFENIETVIVKESRARDCSCSYPLNMAASFLEKGASKAVQNIKDKKVSPLVFKTPLNVEIECFDTGYERSAYQYLLEILSFDKGYQFDEKNSAVSYQANTQLQAYQKFMVIFSILWASK